MRTILAIIMLVLFAQNLSAQREFNPDSISITEDVYSQIKEMQNTEIGIIETYVYFVDIDNDGDEEALANFTIAPSQEMLNSVGNNFFNATNYYQEQGFAVYESHGNDWIPICLVYRNSIDPNVDFDYFYDSYDAKLGIICKKPVYAEEDPMCCPSMEECICLKYNDGVFRISSKSWTKRKEE